MRRWLPPLVLAGLLAMLAPAYAGHDVGPQPPGKFDYYVLALTWVPEFCFSHRGDPECSKHLGFALHGLWPQLEGGDWPSNCSAEALSPEQRDRYESTYPGPSMIDHEWSKHGTCSGQAPAAYFALSSREVARIVIPDAYAQPGNLKASERNTITRAFQSANPGLPASGLGVRVAGGYVTEVDICMTKAGVFRSC